MLSILSLVVLFSLVSECRTAVCSQYSTYYYSTSYIYCSNGCCGTSSSRYCCSSYYNYYTYNNYYYNYATAVSGSTIAGAVIGTMVLIAIIIGVICAVVVRAKKRSTGRVVALNPRPSTNVTTVSSTVQQQQPPVSYMQPGLYPNYPNPAYPPQPPSYYPPPPQVDPYFQAGSNNPNSSEAPNPFNKTTPTYA